MRAMNATTTRQSAAERRDEIIEAALEEFAEHGYHGASTEAIARRAGISQPYVFRLFGTKQELFKAVVTRCFRETLEMFQRAAEGKRGKEALEAMGAAYVACDDPEICAVVRAGYGDLVAYAERVSGLEPVVISAFFAQGMLLNVFASMRLIAGDTEPWADRLLAGCKDPR